MRGRPKSTTGGKGREETARRYTWQQFGGRRTNFVTRGKRGRETWGKRDVREEIITRGSLAEDETQARQPNFVTRGSKLAGDGMNSTRVPRDGQNFRLAVNSNYVVEYFTNTNTTMQ